MEKGIHNGIKDYHKLKMTRAEKERMLQHIFNRPVRSPYYKYVRVFKYLEHSSAFVFVLTLVFASSTITFAAERSLPGQTLYNVKTQVVEPIIGSFNASPEDKLVWEEKRVSRRIAEAEKLAENDKLDDEKAQFLEEKIVESSTAFVQAAEARSHKIATSTEVQKKEVEKIKQSFTAKLQVDNTKSTTTSVASVRLATSSGKIKNAELMMKSGVKADDKESVKSSKNHSEKIKHLKEAAVKTVIEGKNSNKDSEE